MLFKIQDGNETVNCKSILTFKDENNDVNYIVYQEENDDTIYASRYTVQNKNIILKSIENDYEWNLIDNMLERCDK